MRSHFDIVEHFHLRLLRGLSERLRGRIWVLKDGVCLRLFHLSPRLSEDMDLDLDPRVGLASAQNSVDSVLESASFIRMLNPLGVSGMKFSKPKQTETTQRWKVLLTFDNGDEANTKVEISRRRMPEGAKQGIPNATLLAAQSLPPFAASYYPADSMVRQKLAALAAPGRNAARDLFDLHHLLQIGGEVSRQGLTGSSTEALEAGSAKIRAFSLADFREQVLPFLPEDLSDLYRQKPEFEKMRTEVLEMLAQASP
jgi:predicted nucleotidyltransferase component of viral defense system